jgi:hypothetical protein
MTKLATLAALFADDDGWQLQSVDTNVATRFLERHSARMGQVAAQLEEEIALRSRQQARLWDLLASTDAMNESLTRYWTESTKAATVRWPLGTKRRSDACQDEDGDHDKDKKPTGGEPDDDEGKPPPLKRQRCQSPVP